MSTHEAPIHLTIGLVILASLILHRVARLLGQPPLVGDMLAGLLVGVALNLMGTLFFDASNSLAKTTAASLEDLGTIGLVFIVVNALFHAPKNDAESGGISNTRAVLAVTLTNCLPALLIGGWLAVKYASAHELSATPAFIILIGVSMSVSAVPVLAGILVELKLQTSRVGGLAFRAACWTDVIGWILVGLALSLHQNADSSHFILTRLLLVGAMFATLKAIKYGIVRQWFGVASSSQIVLIALLVSSSLTHLASLHVVFGAFLVGSVFASDKDIRESWLKATSWFTDRFFCPLFFAIAGMKLLSSDDFALSELGWGTAFLALCIGSKLIPLMIAGRWIGLSRPESLLLGLLLNTRGLMELVILSVGLSSGIFSPVQYSIFVMVTVATTLMSTPLSRLVQRRLEPSKDT